jgi:hypothetical protein
LADAKDLGLVYCFPSRSNRRTAFKSFLFSSISGFIFSVKFDYYSFFGNPVDRWVHPDHIVTAKSVTRAICMQLSFYHFGNERICILDLEAGDLFN